MEITEPVPWFPLGNMGTVIPSSIYWTEGRPLEVTLRFNEASWVFSRDLFWIAREHGRAGLGDVHVEIDKGTVVMALTSPHGAVKLRTTDAVIRHFTDQVYAVVPLGEDVQSFTDEDLTEAVKTWGTLM